MAAPLFPDSRFFMIEAQPDKKKYLSAVVNRYSGRVGVTIGLLGSAEKQAVPFCLMETGSSVFPERTPFKRSVVELPMCTLDGVVAEYSLDGPFLLKLDVQGSELQVLRGASKTLAQSDVILLETAFLPYNDGAPTFFEVANFMDSAGFFPYDICGLLRRASDQAIFQADFIFVRKNHDLRSDKPFW
jgi:FkbM family methyltransferase